MVVADPYVWGLAAVNYRERPSRAGMETLRYLCNRDSILAAILLTRLGQIVPFCRPNLDEDSEMSTGRSNGFRVRLKKGAGERTDGVKKREEEMTNFFRDCCVTDLPSRERRDRNFVTFAKKFIRDRLEFDQACAYIEMDRSGRPRQFYAVDGSTIRTVDPARKMEHSYVQLYDGKVVTAFYDEEFMFCPENVSSNIKSNGYGLAESEIALRMVQAHLGIDETNSRQFQPGSMPKGLLTLTGADISEQNLRALEAKYRSQVATFRGKHKIPLLPISKGGQLTFIHFPQANDIEFGNFLDYIVNLISALYRIDPAEINFPNRSGGIGGASPSMIQSSPEATRLAASRDKGLRTLIDWFELCINTELMPAVDPNEEFEFQIIGFDRQSESDRLASDDSKSRTYMMINEVREAHGMEPIEGGDIVRDPQFMQTYMQNQQAEAEGEEGGGGAPGDDFEQNWGAEGNLF